jgi:hypothetical protein
MKKCAILTMDCLDDFEAYDHLIDEPMLALGWQTEMVSWRAQNVNWDAYQAVIIRTPWDYQDDAQAFIDVLAQIEASTALLENSLATVKWNINKRYLLELEEQGVNIVPTLWPDNFDINALDEYFTHFDCQQLVIKPCVSANADNTFWLKKSNYRQQADVLASVFKQREFMVQPFIDSVIEEGEFSCFFFDGQYSHCILKTPKENDFRVQEEHGGILKSIEAEPQLMAQALDTVTKIGQLPLYARVDFVRSGEEFALMEAELIEPSLYFNMDPSSAQRFAEAFDKRMQRKAVC